MPFKKHSENELPVLRSIRDSSLLIDDLPSKLASFVQHHHWRVPRFPESVGAEGDHAQFCNVATMLQGV